MRLPDVTKREARGCDTAVPRGTFAFDPELTRCPRSVMTDDVMELVGWWDEWRRYGSMPFGTASFDTEPAFVLDAIDVCQRAFDAAKVEVRDA